MSRQLIFQVGQNRTGTRSIVSLLKGYGYRCAHWESGRIAAAICGNIDSGKPALNGLDQWDVFTDMDPSRKIQSMISRGEATFELTAGWYRYEALYAEHPDAYFILNTRSHERWLKSITRHFKGRKKSDPQFQVEDYIAIRTSTKCRHEKSIREFFAEKSNARFLEVNIESRDAGRQIISFLCQDASKVQNWPHVGRSSLFSIQKIRMKYRRLRKMLREISS